MAGKAFSEVLQGGILLRTLGWRCLLFGFVALGGRLVNAETLTIDVDNHTNAAPLVLSETLTITGTGNGFVQTGAVSGTGDLHFSLSGKESFLLAPNTSTGDLHVDLGTITMTNAAALGTGTVYVNEEETRNVLKVCRLDAGGASMAVGNPFVLGTEDTASWSCRMLCQDGTFSLTGNFSVNRSKIAARSARVSIGGGGERKQGCSCPRFVQRVRC